MGRYWGGGGGTAHGTWRPCNTSSPLNPPQVEDLRHKLTVVSPDDLISFDDYSVRGAGGVTIRYRGQGRGTIRYGGGGGDYSVQEAGEGDYSVRGGGANGAGGRGNG